jgi:hypothetical protein
MGMAGTTARYRNAEEVRLLAQARAAGRVERINDAAALRHVRKVSGMDVARFAKALRVFPGSIVLWERGNRPVPPWLNSRMQDAFPFGTAAVSVTA